MSIVTLFDKSFLQSLSLDEAVMFEDLLRCLGSSRPIRLTPAGGRLYVGLFDCFGDGGDVANNPDAAAFVDQRC